MILKYKSFITFNMKDMKTKAKFSLCEYQWQNSAGMSWAKGSENLDNLLLPAAVFSCQPCTSFLHCSEVCASSHCGCGQQMQTAEILL